jgi:hypothetical protein
MKANNKKFHSIIPRCLSISFEVKKISWQQAVMLADFLNACPRFLTCFLTDEGRRCRGLAFASMFYMLCSVFLEEPMVRVAGDNF